MNRVSIAFEWLGYTAYVLVTATLILHFWDKHKARKKQGVQPRIEVFGRKYKKKNAHKWSA